MPATTSAGGGGMPDTSSGGGGPDGTLRGQPDQGSGSPPQAGPPNGNPPSGDTPAPATQSPAPTSSHKDIAGAVSAEACGYLSGCLTRPPNGTYYGTDSCWRNGTDTGCVARHGCYQLDNCQDNQCQEGTVIRQCIYGGVAQYGTTCSKFFDSFLASCTFDDECKDLVDKENTLDRATIDQACVWPSNPAKGVTLPPSQVDPAAPNYQRPSHPLEYTNKICQALLGCQQRECVQTSGTGIMLNECLFQTCYRMYSLLFYACQFDPFCGDVLTRQTILEYPTWPLLTTICGDVGWTAMPTSAPTPYVSTNIITQKPRGQLSAAIVAQTCTDFQTCVNNPFEDCIGPVVDLGNTIKAGCIYPPGLCNKEYSTFLMACGYDDSCANALNANGQHALTNYTLAALCTALPYETLPPNTPQAAMPPVVITQICRDMWSCANDPNNNCFATGSHFMKCMGDYCHDSFGVFLTACTYDAWCVNSLEQLQNAPTPELVNRLCNGCGFKQTTPAPNVPTTTRVSDQLSTTVVVATIDDLTSCLENSPVDGGCLANTTNPFPIKLACLYGSGPCAGTVNNGCCKSQYENFLLACQYDPTCLSELDKITSQQTIEGLTTIKTVLQQFGDNGQPDDGQNEIGSAPGRVVRQLCMDLYTCLSLPQNGCFASSTDPHKNPFTDCMYGTCMQRTTIFLKACQYDNYCSAQLNMLTGQPKKADIDILCIEVGETTTAAPTTTLPPPEISTVVVAAICNDLDACMTRNPGCYVDNGSGDYGLSSTCTYKPGACATYYSEFLTACTYDDPYCTNRINALQADPITKSFLEQTCMDVSSQEVPKDTPPADVPSDIVKTLCRDMTTCINNPDNDCYANKESLPQCMSSKDKCEQPFTIFLVACRFDSYCFQNIDAITAMPTEERLNQVCTETGSTARPNTTPVVNSDTVSTAVANELCVRFTNCLRSSNSGGQQCIGDQKCGETEIFKSCYTGAGPCTSAYAQFTMGCRLDGLCNQGYAQFASSLTLENTQMLCDSLPSDVETSGNSDENEPSYIVKDVCIIVDNCFKVNNCFASKAAILSCLTNTNQAKGTSSPSDPNGGSAGAQGQCTNQYLVFLSACQHDPACVAKFNSLKGIPTAESFKTVCTASTMTLVPTRAPIATPPPVVETGISRLIVQEICQDFDHCMTRNECWIAPMCAQQPPMAWCRDTDVCYSYPSCNSGQCLVRHINMGANVNSTNNGCCDLSCQSNAYADQCALDYKVPPTKVCGATVDYCEVSVNPNLVSGLNKPNCDSFCAANNAIPVNAWNDDENSCTGTRTEMGTWKEWQGDFICRCSSTKDIRIAPLMPCITECLGDVTCHGMYDNYLRNANHTIDFTHAYDNFKIHGNCNSDPGNTVYNTPGDPSSGVDYSQSRQPDPKYTLCHYAGAYEKFISPCLNHKQGNLAGEVDPLCTSHGTGVCADEYTNFMSACAYDDECMQSFSLSGLKHAQLDHFCTAVDNNKLPEGANNVQTPSKVMVEVCNDFVQCATIQECWLDNDGNNEMFDTACISMKCWTTFNIFNIACKYDPICHKAIQSVGNFTKTSISYICYIDGTNKIKTGGPAFLPTWAPTAPPPSVSSTTGGDHLPGGEPSIPDQDVYTTDQPSHFNTGFPPVDPSLSPTLSPTSQVTQRSPDSGKLPGGQSRIPEQDKVPGSNTTPPPANTGMPPIVTEPSPGQTPSPTVQPGSPTKSPIASPPQGPATSSGSGPSGPSSSSGPAPTDDQGNTIAPVITPSPGSTVPGQTQLEGGVAQKVNTTAPPSSSTGLWIAVLIGFCFVGGGVFWYLKSKGMYASFDGYDNFDDLLSTPGPTSNRASGSGMELQRVDA